MFLYGTPVWFGAVEYRADKNLRLGILSTNTGHIPRAHLWSQVIHGGNYTTEYTEDTEIFTTRFR
jgi:hypothetical protein